MAKTAFCSKQPKGGSNVAVTHGIGARKQREENTEASGVSTYQPNVRDCRKRNATEQQQNQPKMRRKRKTVPRRNPLKPKMLPSRKLVA